MAALVLVVPHLPGVNLEHAAAALLAARPLPLWGALALFVGALLCSAAAWRSAVHACGGSIGRGRAVACYGTGSLINSLVPARVGDAVRITLFSRALPTEGRLWATGGIFAAMQTVGAAGMLCLGAAAAFVGVMPIWTLAVPAGLVIALAGITVRARRAEPHSRASHLFDAFRAFGRSPRTAAAPTAWQAGALVARFFAAALVAAALGSGSPLVVALVLVPAVELAALIPLTPGNLGLTSAAAALALHATGTGSAQALTIGIGFHAAETVAGLSFGALAALHLGGGVHMPRTRRATAALASIGRTLRAA